MEKGLKSAIELMREHGASPKDGRAVPIEAIYEANTISYEQYRAILAEMDAERRNWRSAQVADEMVGQSAMLSDKLTRAGVPSRYASVAIDKTMNDVFDAGRWVCVQGPDVDSVTRKACALLKGFASDNPFATIVFERSTTAVSSFTGTNSTESMTRLSTARMLLLSGLGSENATGWAVSKLGELLDTRFGSELPLIVTTRHMPEELAAHLGDRAGDGNARGIVELLRKQSVLVRV
jgi:hypothetical protein